MDWRRSGILSRLSGPNLFDMHFFWWTYFVAFIVQITFDVIAYDSPSWLWLPVWTGGHLLATAAAIVIRWGFLDAYLSRKPNPYLNILVAGVLGLIRVTFIGYASFALELQGMFDLGARVIAGAISGGGGLFSYRQLHREFQVPSRPKQRFIKDSGPTSQPKKGSAAVGARVPARSTAKSRAAN